MPIVSHSVVDLSPRDTVLADLDIMIDEAAHSQEDIAPWTLARNILEFIEAKINSVDHDGNVIYRV